MTRSSTRKRIRVTKTGIIMRRRMGVDHFRSKKSGNQRRRKGKSTGLNYKGLG